MVKHQKICTCEQANAPDDTLGFPSLGISPLLCPCPVFFCLLCIHWQFHMRFCEFKNIPHSKDSKISEGRLWQRSDDITYPTSLTCSLTRSTKQGTSMFQPITAIHSPTLSPTTNRTSQPTNHIKLTLPIMLPTS